MVTDGRQREAPIVERPQDAADQRDLEQRRQHVEQHEEQQELDALGAALDRAGQAAGLPVEMEAQRQRMQVAEGLQRDVADRALRHAGEDAVAQFGEELGRDPRQAIGESRPTGTAMATVAAGRARLRPRAASGRRPWP